MSATGGAGGQARPTALAPRCTPGAAHTAGDARQPGTIAADKRPRAPPSTSPPGIRGPDNSRTPTRDHPAAGDRTVGWLL
eukprot:7454094-Alexandrium_andersonii.AAC.1